jgi:hypothetical protein
MPVFTAIGATIGLAGAAATTAGLGIAAAGAAAYAVGSAGKGSGQDGSYQPPAGPTDAGGLTEAEAQTAAKKRAFRSGVMFTSPTGLDSDPRTSSAKLR